MKFVYILGLLALFNIPCLAVCNMMGVIKFPGYATLINPPRVYCAGRILPTEVDDKVKEVSFTFPCKSTQRVFFMVIAEKVQPVFDSRNKNTVLYLKIPANSTYKAYQLQRVAHEKEDEWRIEQCDLTFYDNRLPDSAIIVLFPPEEIHALSGGTNFALPTLCVKAHELDVAPDSFKDISTKLLLSSLDMDTLHTVVPRHIKHIEEKGRTIIMPTM